jgi:hypothetical protein
VRTQTRPAKSASQSRSRPTAFGNYGGIELTVKLKPRQRKAEIPRTNLPALPSFGRALAVLQQDANSRCAQHGR